jgi:signal transduction histidine kinase
MNLLDHDNDSLYDLIKALSANQDLDEVLDHVRDIFLNRLNFDIVLYIFYDAVSESLSAPLAFNKSMFVEKYFDPLDKDSRWINEFSTKLAILTRNHAERPLFSDMQHEMLAPIASGEMLLGAIYTGRKKDDPFSIQQKRYVDIVSTFLAIPFEKLLSGSLQKPVMAIKELSSSSPPSDDQKDPKDVEQAKWTLELIKSLDYQKIEPGVEQLALTLNSEIEFDYFSFYHLQPDRMEADFYELAHPSLKTEFSTKVTLQDTEKELAWVQRQSTPVISRVDQQRLPYSLPAHASVPVMFRDHYYGTLAIGRKNDLPFTARENEWIKVGASLLGLLVATSSASATSVEHKDTDPLAKVAVSIMSCLKMETMLRECCYQLKIFFKADKCSIRSVDDGTELWFPENMRQNLDRERAKEWKQQIVQEPNPLFVDDPAKFLLDPGQMDDQMRFALLPVRKNARCVGAFILTQFHTVPQNEIFQEQGSFLVSVLETALLNSQTFENNQKQIAQLQEFNRTLAHDLKAPLASIKSYFELLHQEKAHEFDMHTKYQERIQANLQVMDALIEDLLVYYRLSGDGEEVQSVFSGDIVRQILDSLHGLIEKYHIEVIVGSDLPQVKVQETALQQIFRNLISNAIQACKQSEQPRIEITSWKRLLDDEFLVKDNGPGIEPGLETELFKPFSKAFAGGTGLGLAIAKRAVQAQGGEIGYTSQPGQGATFYFTIPRKDK